MRASAAGLGASASLSGCEWSNGPLLLAAPGDVGSKVDGGQKWTELEERCAFQGAAGERQALEGHL